MHFEKMPRRRKTESEEAQRLRAGSGLLPRHVAQGHGQRCARSKGSTLTMPSHRLLVSAFADGGQFHPPPLVNPHATNNTGILASDSKIEWA